ncbi:MAG: cell division protein SepF [Clostridia bacterium]|nr:cell division protein SepF [Clostridia bacterium]MBR6498231.1 cell division protein SepF [Clostridia bacterium]
MADLSRFTALLQKLKLVSIEDEDGDDYLDQAPSRGYQQPRRQQESSLYEDAYARSRGQQARREARQTTRKTGSPSAQLRQDGAKPVSRPDTMVYYISQLGECAEVIKDIIAGTSAVINFDGTDDFTAQRIIDTLAGAAFALNAKVRKITDNTYFIAPKNVNVNMSRHIERRY